MKTSCRLGLAALICLITVAAEAQEVREIRDVPYGGDPLQQLDVYLPSNATGKLPAVLWIHGGGWREGDKRTGSNQIGTFANDLVSRGYVAISCNYRLLPKHLHPAQIDDGQRVVRWLRKHAAEYHIDPDRIGTAGISAGGHLAAMLAVKSDHQSQGDDLDGISSRVNVAVSLAGPTDFSDRAELVTPIINDSLLGLAGGSADRLKEIRTGLSPITYVTPATAPLLFIVGTKDPWVPNQHADVMAEALRKSQVETSVVRLEGQGHGIFPSVVPEARDATLKWLDRHLKKDVSAGT
jgi:acetyl esterase/lipase